VSSYAFGNALKTKASNKLILIDIEKSDEIDPFFDECEYSGINVTFHEGSDLTCPMEPTELLFIDTWHVYGQLKRELKRWHPNVSKYIILHDTTVDGEIGESVRMGYDIEKEIVQSGFTEEEIRKGLWPAVEEFLVDHPEWRLKEKFTNNNGLTVLERLANST
jgi:hypothetical protein